jgi:hypothetical protein
VSEIDTRYPRYTGRQVWNKQRTDEVLMDVNDVALGHTAVMRWNPTDKWVVSNAVVHEPLVSDEDFERRLASPLCRAPNWRS